MTVSKKPKKTRKASKKEKNVTRKTSKSKSVARVTVSSEVLKHLGVESQDAEAIRAFMTLSDHARIGASRKVIQDTIINASRPPDARFGLAVAESQTLLTGYATLDDPHRSE